MGKEGDEKKEKKKEKEKDKDKEKEKKPKEKKEDKSEKKEKKEAKEAKKQPVEAPRPSRGPPPPKATDSNDYLAGMDLPSSEESEDEHEKSARAGEERKVILGGGPGDSKKIADKERKTMEKAFQIKQEALRDDDDNVFDVAFEGQGDENAIASATDVKVSPKQQEPSSHVSIYCCYGAH
jgi:ATP-binding cassette subfamily F protein 1